MVCLPALKLRMFITIRMLSKKMVCANNEITHIYYNKNAEHTNGLSTSTEITHIYDNKNDEHTNGLSAFTEIFAHLLQ